MKKIEDCRIISNKMISEDVFEIQLETKEIAAASKPGQFVEVKLDSLFLRRPISIGKIEENTLYLYVKIVGRGTLNLSKMKVDERVNVIGPLGNSFEAMEDKKIVLVGGGIGIAPLINIANTYRNDYYVFAGFKEEAYGTEVFDRVAIEKHYVIESKDQCFVTDVLEKEIDRIKPDCIMSCGPAKMMKKIALIAKERQIETYLSLEERMGCGFGACVGCSIVMKNGEIKKVCVDGPVFSSEGVNYYEW